MRRLLWAVAILAGCGSVEPGTAPRSACGCETKICVCPHCAGSAPRCPCGQMEKPQ